MTNNYTNVLLSNIVTKTRTYSTIMTKTNHDLYIHNKKSSEVIPSIYYANAYTLKLDILTNNKNKSNIYIDELIINQLKFT